MEIDLEEVEEQLSYDKMWSVGWNVRSELIGESNPHMSEGDVEGLMSDFYTAVGLFFGKDGKEIYKKEEMEEGSLKRFDMSEKAIREFQNPFSVNHFYCSLRYEEERENVRALVNLTDGQKQSDLGGFMDFLLYHSSEGNHVY